jgi:hypothetical protein
MLLLFHRLLFAGSDGTPISNVPKFLGLRLGSHLRRAGEIDGGQAGGTWLLPY